MRIQSSTIHMEASHHKQAQQTNQESLQVWVDERDAQSDLTTMVDISKEGKELSRLHSADCEEIELQADPSELNKIVVVQRMLEKLMGKSLKFIIPQKIVLKQQNTDIQIKQPSSENRFGWGMVYQKLSEYHEHETLDFTATGVIVKADGTTLDISLALSMSRSFASRESLTITAGDALVDPLVINYGAGTAGLTEQKYEFDIDCDGSNDLISFVKEGSGFLAYDKNNDGVINDGRELFGPATGNGFLELSEFDWDENGWIDENDPIYDNLKIWCKDENGENKLFAIGQKGIGAIYLGNIDTQFSLANAENQLLGQIQKTGIFLTEQGQTGTIQHVDLSL